MKQPLIIRINDRIIAAGEEIDIFCHGCNYFRVLSSLNDIDVSFNKGPEVRFRYGQSYRFNENLDVVTLRNNGTAANIITAVVSDGQYNDDALSIANVITTKHSNLLDTLSGKVFSMGAVVAGTASTYGITGIVNPAGSGKRLYINRIEISASASVQLNAKRFTEAALPVSLNGAYGRSNLLGSADGTGVMKFGTVNAITTPTQDLWQTWLTSAPLVMDLINNPIVLPAGQCFMLELQSLNVQYRAKIDWKEE